MAKTTTRETFGFNEAEVDAFRKLLEEPKKCTTCNKALDRPYRREVEGEIVEGCIAEDHNLHVGDDAWHNRPSAVEHRARVARRKREVLNS